MSVIDWPDTYQTYIFSTWYSSGKPGANQLYQIIDPHENGQKPDIKMLTRWIQEIYIPSSLKTDEMAMEKLHTDLADKKAQVLSRHAELGMKLQEMGIKYLEENGITRARDAIDAIKLGVTIERDAMFGQNIATLEKLSKLDDDALMDVLRDMAETVTLDITAKDPEEDN